MIDTNRLIQLDQKPGLRTIGVREVLRRIAGKAVMMLHKKDVTKSAQSLQLSAGEETGSEATIHATINIFADIDMDAVLLISAENAFNSMNYKLMLHNLKFVYPIIAVYIINCYATPSR